MKSFILELRLPPIAVVGFDPMAWLLLAAATPFSPAPVPSIFPFIGDRPPPAADNGDDVDEIDGFNRFGVDLLVSGTVLFAAVISEFSPTRTLHAGFDHVKTFDPNLLAHKSGFISVFFCHRRRRGRCRWCSIVGCCVVVQPRGGASASDRVVVVVFVICSVHQLHV